LKRGVSSCLSYDEKFADLSLADWNTEENCVFAIRRLIMQNLRICDLRICDSVLSPRICGFTDYNTKFTCPPLTLCHVY
jgi:hypothetical protein